jgi:cell division protein FtsB
MEWRAPQPRRACNAHSYFRCAAVKRLAPQRGGDFTPGQGIIPISLSPSGEGQLAFFRGVKRRAQALVLPVVFFALCGYFAHHAMHGTRGLLARDARNAEIVAARIVLAEAEAERDAMERKVAGLRAEHLDRDMLEERARALLNVVAKDEVIVPYAPNRRLF